MRNRRRSKAKHRCQKATKQVKVQTDGRGGKESNALNIQMFIDASVRNGFDTLKTSLKFFLFKIYTSEASKRSSRKRCRDSVRSQRYFSTSSPKSYWSHKSNVTRFPRTERAVFTGVTVATVVLPNPSTDLLHTSLRRVQACSGPVGSVRSGGRQQLPKPFKCTAVLRSKSQSVSPRAFHRAQFDPPLYNFSIGTFFMEFINFFFFLLIYTNSFLPGPEQETELLVKTKQVKYS